MVTRLQVGEMAVEVAFKDIKNVHLSVHPPAGRVSISAPRRMKLETVRVFAISKLDWIKRQQQKIRSQEREPQREYLDRESHYVWGKRYLLSIVETDKTSKVELKHSKMIVHVRPGTTRVKHAMLIDAWYRSQVREATTRLIAKWEPLLQVRVARFHVQRMKTKWGSSNPSSRNIRLNTDLAKKPRECLEYIIVHEMCHLLEPTHNASFVVLMDRLMPHWRSLREQLSRLPVRHEHWQ